MDAQKSEGEAPLISLLLVTPGFPGGSSQVRRGDSVEAHHCRWFAGGAG